MDILSPSKFKIITNNDILPNTPLTATVDSNYIFDLPKEYGGDAGPFDNKESSEAVYGMLEYFSQVKKYASQWFIKPDIILMS